MRIIGFHSGHDCAYCVLEDGIPVVHEELERINRVKQSSGDSIELYNERGFAKDTDSTFCHHFNNGGHNALIEYPDSYHKLMDRPDSSFYDPGHHGAHAANAFFTSDYDKSLIFTIDAGGWERNVQGELSPSMEVGVAMPTSTAVWRGEKNKIWHEKIYTMHLDIGGVWHKILEPVFGLSAGPPKGNQAGTLMAMASVGDGSKYYDHIVNNFHYTRIDYKWLKEEHDSSDQAPFDIARALQDATEFHLRNLIARHIKPEDKDLCFAGGVALNSVALGKVFDWFPQVENIFVPPAPYDGGLAIGTAQYIYHHFLGYPRVKDNKNASPYLGKKYTEEEVLAALEAAGDKIEFHEAPVSELVDKLLDAKIVSVFNGGSESGRRALGNRSILADPRNPDMKDIINEKVKHRQWFRPFAPSILAEETANWFTRDVYSPYMSVVLPFKEEVRDKVPAVVHLDGTGRLQTVTEELNPWYYNFLKDWHKASGVPIILNTSFNDREPIVETPENAINCFLGTNIDNLYFVETGIMVSKTNKGEDS